MSGKNKSGIKRTASLLDRLFSYRYDILIEEGEEYREQGRKKIEEAEVVARENDEKRKELDAKERDLDEKERGLILRECVVKTKEKGAEKLHNNAVKQYEKAVEMASRVGQEMNKVEETKKALRTMLEGLIAKGADQVELQSMLDMLNNLRPELEAERRITDESLTRDDCVMQALLTLKQKAIDLKYALEQKQGVEGRDKRSAIYIRENLRAALIAIVAFYRDTLSEVDATTFYINGQSCIEFLYEQTEKINTSYTGKWINRELADDNIQNVMREVYVDLADRLGYSAYEGNEDLLHGSRKRYGYPNYVGMRINRECIEQLSCCFKLEKVDERSEVDIPRATVDVAVPSSLEAEIAETAKIFKDMDR